jgi:hypothetical protein
MKQRRRSAFAGLVLALFVLGCATAPTLAGTAGAAPPPDATRTAGSAVVDEVTIGGARSDGQDARGLRFGLLGLLGLALGFGAFVQSRTSADLPPAPPRTRRRTGPERVRDAKPDGSPAAPPAPAQPDTPVAPTAAPPPPHPPARYATGPQPIHLEPYLRDRLDAQPRVARQPLALTPAEEDCARAITAAHRYDRRATLAAFVTALAGDPGVKPSALPGFWEMPPSGHADLARAYLRRGDRLNARTVLSLALLTFPHDRELATLLRETERPRREETA